MVDCPASTSPLLTIPAARIRYGPRPAQEESNGDAVADAIVGELGYTQSYKRAFRTIGNVALSIGISS
jgi:hypothetical protein